MDADGSVVIPGSLRAALGLRPGSSVEISLCGSGLHLAPVGPTARLVTEAGVLVATGETPIDDEVVSGLIDDGRR